MGEFFLDVRREGCVLFPHVPPLPTYDPMCQRQKEITKKIDTVYTLNPNVNWEWVELSALNIYLSTWSMVFCSMRHSYVLVSNVCCQLLYTFLNCLSRYRGKSIADFLSQEQNKEIKMKEVKFFSLNGLSYFDPLTKKSWIPNHKIVWGVALWQNRKSYGFTASWKTAYNSRQTL